MGLGRFNAVEHGHAFEGLLRRLLCMVTQRFSKYFVAASLNLGKSKIASGVAQPILGTTGERSGGDGCLPA